MQNPDTFPIGFDYSPGSIVRIDPQSGAETLIWQGAAATPDGPGIYDDSAAVEPNGIVLFTGTLGSATDGSGGQIGVFQLDPTAANPTPTLLDGTARDAVDGGTEYVQDLAIGPHGEIYGLRPSQSMQNPDTFPIGFDYSPGSIARIDPQSGAETLIWQGAAATPDGPGAFNSSAAVEPNGMVLFTGGLGSATDGSGGQVGVFQLDPTAANPTPTLFDGTTRGAVDGGTEYVQSLAVGSARLQSPAITWATPGDIIYGTALGGGQLDATASVPGSFSYSPAAGTVLNAGMSQTLIVTFTPSDATLYTTVTATTTINVNQANPSITWANPSDIAYGTALGGTQMDATASVPGTFSYSPAVGTLLTAGHAQVLSVKFTPSDTTDYTTATSTTSINVDQANPSITWANPSDITYGTILGGAQLDATASVPGTFSYSPAVGTVLTVGQAQVLSVKFTPSDTTDYTTATAATIINVKQASPVITWVNPSDITYGTALGATQLDATASVPGTFSYSPAAGTVLNAGQGQTLNVTFSPTDTSDYTPATAAVGINVNSATPVVSVSDTGGPDNGQPYPASGTATGVGGAAVTGSFIFAYTDSQNNSLAAAPSSVGSYRVVANFTSADPNYTNSSSLPLTFSISPGPSGPIATDTPSFAWSRLAGANHYSLKVTQGKTVVLNVAKVSTTTYALPAAHALTPGQSYVWSVAPVNTGGKAIGPTSTVTFQILPIGAPSPSGPTGLISTDRPTFTWIPVADAGHISGAHFTLKITDTTTRHVFTVVNLTGTSYALTTAQALTPGDSYAWSVTAFSTNRKATITGQSAHFTVAALTAPVQLSFASATDTFTWQPVADAGHYALTVIAGAAGATVVSIPKAAGTTYQLTPTQAKALKQGRSYTWYVTVVSTNDKVAVRSIGQEFTNSTDAGYAGSVGSRDTGVLAI
jgi:hypothetical protein